MVIIFERKRTSTIVVMYSLYLYFLGLSLRNTSKALTIFKDEKRSYVSVWNLIQRFAEYPVYKRKRISAFIIDETTIKLEINAFGCGFILNLFTDLCLALIFQKRETCL